MSDKIDPETTYVTSRWLWVLDVVFGATAAYGFQNLQNTIRAVSDSPPELFKQIMVAVSLYIFFLYDLTAVHILAKRYPYRVSATSGCRFLLDVAMAFLLMLMLIPGLQQNPEQSTILILTTLTIWHVLAFFWHVLANLEYGTQMDATKIGVHFLFAAIYWIVLGGLWAFQSFLEVPANTSAVMSIYFLSITIAIVAMFRICRIVQIFHVGPA